MVNDFINELAKDWWLVCKYNHVELDPSNGRCIHLLEGLLREEYEFEEDTIEYVVEVMSVPPRPAPTHIGKKGNTDSGIDVEDDETSVSVHLDDFDEEDDDIDESINEGETWVKNIKSGNVYTVDQSSFNAKTHSKATDAEIAKAKDDGDSEEDEPDDNLTDTQEDQPPEDSEARDKAESDIQQNSLTALERDKKKPKLESGENNDNLGGLFGDPDTGDFNVKSNMLKYGFSGYTKATGKKPAPGSPGSAFNEIMSGNGVHNLKKNPDLTESELVEIMYNETIKTKLGQEQTRTSNVGKIPSDIENKNLYSKCIISARSARTKYDATMSNVESLNKSGKFGEVKSIDTFYGASESIEAQLDLVRESNSILLPNGTSISKSDIKVFIKEGGGGMNPSDTATFASDTDGNLMVQFHSDKTSTADIQDNSTLIQEGTNYKETIDSSNLDQTQKLKAKTIVDKYTDQISEIEDGYVDQTIPIASNLKNADLDAQLDIIENDKGTLKKNINNAIFGKTGIKSQYKDYIPDGAKFDNLSLKDQYQMVLNLVTDGNGKVNDVKVINKVALQLQTDNPDIKGIDVKTLLSDQREKVVNLQRDRVQELDKMTTKIDGKEIGLGTLMEANEAIRGFHLELMDYPPKGYTENDPKSLIGNSLDINMGGTSVNGDTLRKCMGVKNTLEFKKRFSLKTEEKYLKDKSGNVTGKDVFVYTLDRDGNQIDIGKKSYRSKQGATGRTNNTMAYSTNMQKCFKNK
jgi:hypothetical protein